MCLIMIFKDAEASKIPPTPSIIGSGPSSTRRAGGATASGAKITACRFITAPRVAPKSNKEASEGLNTSCMQNTRGECRCSKVSEVRHVTYPRRDSIKSYDFLVNIPSASISRFRGGTHLRGHRRHAPSSSPAAEPKSGRSRRPPLLCSAFRSTYL